MDRSGTLTSATTPRRGRRCRKKLVDARVRASYKTFEEAVDVERAAEGEITDGDRKRDNTDGRRGDEKT